MPVSTFVRTENNTATSSVVYNDEWRENIRAKVKLATETHAENNKKYEDAIKMWKKRAQLAESDLAKLRGYKETLV